MGYHAINRDTIALERINRVMTDTLILSTPGTLQGLNLCLSLILTVSWSPEYRLTPPIFYIYTANIIDIV